jgi:outer membrane protein OmpA-like peptidoglycan-associated protein
LLPVIALASCGVLLATGCTTKKYVRSQTAPVVQKTNELDAATARNSRDLDDVNTRAQAGIAQAQTSANQANTNAQAASASATQAQGTADEAIHRVNSLSDAVANLDSYRPVADVSVYFAFNSSTLTRKDRGDLDAFGGKIGPNDSGYILEVTGATDIVGSAAYNYKLSDDRAQSVIQYLATKYNVPPHRIYLLGVGKDNASASGSAHSRAKDRKVEVRLLNHTGSATPQTTPTPGA